MAVGEAEDAQPLYIQLVGAPDDVALVAYGRLFAAAQTQGDLQGMRDLTQAAEDAVPWPNGSVLSDLWTGSARRHSARAT